MAKTANTFTSGSQFILGLLQVDNWHQNIVEAKREIFLEN